MSAVRTCEAKIPWWPELAGMDFGMSAGPALPGVGWRICGAPATEVYDYGCVHEHVIADKATCGDHSPERGEIGCRLCFEAGHDCEMTFRRRELAS